MKNRSSVLRVLVLLLSMLVAMASMPMSFSAASVVSPRYNNLIDYACEFFIDENGLAEIYYRVNGEEGLTERIDVEVVIQRKNLLWWSDVEGLSWSHLALCSSISYSDSRELTKTGKYRAIFTITVIGTGGDTDVIEETLTYEY